MKRLLVIIVSVMVVIVGASAVWYLASPLFIDNVVDEGFPETDKVKAEALIAAADMPDKQMDDPMPEAVSDAPAVIGQGQFQDADSFHKGSGTATIYQLPEGGHVLRFEDFSATNGPDLHVLLVEEAAPSSQDQIMTGYLDLGSLKGNIGNQNYEIPAGTDVSKYKSVVIYCMPFHVIFATASLN